MKKYVIEIYNTEKDVGCGFLGVEYTNKSKAIKAAKDLQKQLCNEDYKHTIFIVHKKVEEELEEVYETKNNLKY